MRSFADIAAKALSTLLYPLFVPTYGVALFCYALTERTQALPLVWSAVAVIGTFILTCILPVTSIWILIRQGKVKDLEIADAGERTMPYIYTLLGFGFWSYLMISILHAPLFLGLVTVGAAVAIGLIAFINRRWKISAHLTGMGGLFGGFMSYCLGVGIFPGWGMISLWLCITLALMYARVHLNAHTPAQVCAGWLLGIACTFLPVAYAYYGA